MNREQIVIIASLVCLPVAAYFGVNWNRVPKDVIGFTREEIRSRFGDPGIIHPGNESGDYELWVYGRGWTGTSIWFVDDVVEGARYETPGD